MSRQSDRQKNVRLEVRFNKDDPVLKELEQEARVRGKSVADHVKDLLQKRFAARRGQDYDGTLWLPVAENATPAAEPEPEPPPKGASSAAAVWLKRRPGS